MLRFAVYDWDSGEVTDDTKGQDNLGTMECSLAEIVKQSGKRVRVSHREYGKRVFRVNMNIIRHYLKL